MYHTKLETTYTFLQIMHSHFQTHLTLTVILVWSNAISMIQMSLETVQEESGAITEHAEASFFKAIWSIPNASWSV